MNKNSHIVTIQSILLAIVGLCLIVQPILGFVGEHLHLRTRILPIIAYDANPQVILTIIGITLIYLTFYLYKRREIAYFSSIVLAASALAVLLSQRHKAIIIIVLMIMFLLIMLFTRQYYQRKSDIVSLTFSVRVAIAIASIAYVYGCVGFFLLGPAAFHIHFSIGNAAFYSLQTLFTFQDVSAPTRLADTFLSSLNAVSLLLIVLIFSSLFKPVRLALLSSHPDTNRALDILRKNSLSSEDYFKLWPSDKQYYFSDSGQSFLAYKTSRQTAIILGDPSGAINEFAELIVNFKDFVQKNGWLVAAINATIISDDIYQELGFKKLFIGNEAILSIPDYITYTVKSKHFRYIYNKAKRDGLEVEYWHTIDEQKLAILKHVSDSWLARNGRKEYTFFMGYFDSDYIKSSKIMVLKQDKKVVAYINVIPSFVDNEASIDHLRSVDGASAASMHYLLAELINKLHSQGKQSLNIGFAPLSGIEQQIGKRIGVEQVLKLLKKFGNRFYSFQGVEQFKGKFQPKWHPRYLYYSAALTTVVQDIDHASKFGADRLRKSKIFSIIVAVVLAFIIVQFI